MWYASCIFSDLSSSQCGVLAYAATITLTCMDILTTEVMTLTQISTNSTSDYGVFCTPAYGVFCTPAYGVFCTPAYGVFYTAVALISNRYFTLFSLFFIISLGVWVLLLSTNPEIWTALSDLHFIAPCSMSKKIWKMMASLLELWNCYTWCQWKGMEKWCIAKRMDLRC